MSVPYRDLRSFREELLEIVVRPATIAGLSFEPRLVDRILDDIGQEPGNLLLHGGIAHGVRCLHREGVPH